MKDITLEQVILDMHKRKERRIEEIENEANKDRRSILMHNDVERTKQEFMLGSLILNDGSESVFDTHDLLVFSYGASQLKRNRAKREKIEQESKKRKATA